MYNRVLLVFFGFLFSTSLLATHNRAGEITFEQIGDLTIRMTITTYTKTSSVPADRDTLEVFWGDGTSEMVGRVNGNGIPLPNDVKLNYYVAIHTYPGRATYTISMMDPNRNGGILNVNPPNSDNVPFYLETTFSFLNPQFQGYNNSAVLLQPPLDFACVGEVFIHNPNAYDPDGDSLSYELIIPLQDSGTLVPNYSFPNQINPGGNNVISLNPVTGDFVWNAPQVQGEYNIAIRIYEYRNGQLINSMIRDMQILVFICDNKAPNLEVANEFCVVAGDLLEFDIQVSDPNLEDLVAISALGGPFEVSPSAELEMNGIYQLQPFTAKFSWRPSCNHIADQYYSVVFRAVDDYLDTTGLAILKTVRIKVVGPPPQNVQAQSDDEQVRVNWDWPYACDQTEDDYFKGFSVWRRLGSNNFPIDTCDPGLDGKGYTQIGFNIKTIDAGRYTFIDENVERGKTYCYRVLGEFALTSPGGNPYNRVASLPSDEACVQLNRDIPLLTKVDVESTDPASGTIQLRWAKPLTSALDTLEYPGPYRFVVEHSPGMNNGNFTAIPGASFTSQFFANYVDTSFLHTGLNTRDMAHQYRIAFYANGISQLYDYSPPASSLYLTTAPTDQANNLSWEAEVPWDNYSFDVFRKQGSDDYSLIATVTTDSYKDTGLTNGEEYCYYILATGSYGIARIEDPLFNKSQEQCSIPVDNVPPCPPIIAVTNLCNDQGSMLPEDEFENTVTWSDPPPGECGLPEVPSSYNIYFSPGMSSDFSLVGSVDAGAPHIFTHNPDVGIAGCYAVTSLDELGNESGFSNFICVDNCPFYSLPNAFTPNGDGNNDEFIPFPYRFIDRIDIQVFNRWGQLVFSTNDPDINWDGRDKQGNNLADGVYHYVCLVYEQGLVSVQPTVLKGYIELIRGSN